MTWNIYDIGTISLRLALGMIAASEMVISKKLILLTLLIISTIFYISLKNKKSKQNG